MARATAYVGILLGLIGVLTCCMRTESNVGVATVSGGTLQNDQNDHEVVFSVDNGVTRENYRVFIESLRSRLGATVHYESGIRRLRSRDEVLENQRFVQVRLVFEDDSVTLGIDVVNLYVYAYRVGGMSYFFRDAPSFAQRYLFQGTVQTSLPFESSYPQLGDRSHTELGIPRLQVAINTIAHDRVVNHHRSHLLVMIQMVAEAARMSTIETRIARTIRQPNYESFTPNAVMMDLENSWGQLSDRVQNANQDGVFRTPVGIRNLRGETENIQSVRRVVGVLAVMLYQCNNGNRKMNMNNQTMGMEVIAEDKQQCAGEQEMSVRLVGRNGLCLDIKDRSYKDGNVVHLWTCGKQDSQVWKIKKDRTIRTASMDMCLAQGSKPSQDVGIYTCQRKDKSAISWDLSSDGNIAPYYDRYSSALTASGGNKGSRLTVAANRLSVNQSWQPWISDVQPYIFTTGIVGYGGVCLGASGKFNDVTLGECDDNNNSQRWAIYDDGTIRPDRHRTSCLTVFSPSRSREYVTLENCAVTNLQRWDFRGDGMITFVVDGKLMDLVSSDPKNPKITLNDNNGSPTQKWVQTY